jgi:ABC-type amino acid transport substrate-binding protein
MAGWRTRGAALRIVIGTAVLACVVASSARASTCPAGRVRGMRGDRLVVGVSAAPPFAVATSNDSQVYGPAIGLLRVLAASEGWRLALVELSPETLRTRLAACELDVGVVGVPVSAALDASLDLSQSYLSTVTTVIVNAHDVAGAGPLAAIPEQFAHLLPPGSPLRAHLDVALLRHHECAGIAPPVTRCPGAAP